MGFEVTGKLHRKLDEQQVSEKFRKREFVLEITDGSYAQHIKFQLVQDRVSLVDAFREGENIKVFFDLTGREFEKNGEKLYFTNLSAWKIDRPGGSTGGNTGAQPEETPFTGTAEGIGGGEALDDLPF